MADEPKSFPPPEDGAFVKNARGEAVQATQEQIDTALGGWDRIPEAIKGAATGQEAYATAQGRIDKALADQIGNTGAFAGGAVQGATFGLGIPAAIGMAEILGVGDPNQARHRLAGLQGNSAYHLGQGAGLLGATVATAGMGDAVLGAAGLESLAGEGASILGRAIAGGVRMTPDGILMGMGQAAEEAAIANKPLAAEAFLARAGEGGLLAFSLGGALGGAGAVLGKAIGASEGVLSSAFSKDALASRMLGNAGAEKGLLKELGAMEGGQVAFAERAATYADKEGIRLAEAVKSPEKLTRMANKLETEALSARKVVLSEFDREAGAYAPRWADFAEKVNTEVSASYGMAPGGLDYADKIADLMESLKPVGKGFNGRRFQLWAENRDFMEEGLKGIRPQDKETIKRLYDAEIGEAMNKAEANVMGLKGASGRYQSTELTIQDAKALARMGEAGSDKLIGGKGVVDQALSSSLPSVGFALAVDPVGGLVYGGGKLAFKSMVEKYGPIVTENMFRSKMGTTVSNAIGGIKSDIASGVSSFLTKGAVKGASSPKSSKFNRKDYDAQIERLNQAMSISRESRLQSYTRHTGSLALGEAMTQANERAMKFLAANIPPSAQAQRAMSLKAQPIPALLSYDEHKFMSKLGVLKNPLSIISDLKKGTVSASSVETLKEVWPEIYGQVVSEAQNQVSQLKADGKSLNMDKITQLSILLDAPLDTTLSREFIDPVQQAMIPSEPPPPPKQSPAGTDASSYEVESESLQQ